MNRQRTTKEILIRQQESIVNDLALDETLNYSSWFISLLKDLSLPRRTRDALKEKAEAFYKKLIEEQTKKLS